MEDKGELFFANAYLKKHFDRIVDWAVGDIKRCSRINPDGTCDNNGALVGAFILWCCAIEYFGGLYTGNADNGGTLKRYREFINKYMPHYDYQKIYDLRWSLLHYYSPHHFALVHENNLEFNKDKHLMKTNRGIYLHLGWSIKDLELAINNYKKDLESSSELKIKAWRYYKKQLPIMPVEIGELKPISNSLIVTGTSIQPISASGTVAESNWFK